MVQQIGFKCNRGVVRKNNEDACFVMPGHDVYMVADGVGGNNSGEIASSTAVEMIAEYIKDRNLRGCETPDEIFGMFTEAIDIANEAVFSKGRENPENRGMATTIVMAYIYDGAAYIANIGDSRAYLYRKGMFRKITRDHTYVNELIEQGLLTEEEAETHSQKNVITKALGAEPAVDPDFYRVGLQKDDVLILCSDGLYGEVGEDVISDCIGKGRGMTDLCADLVNEAIKAGGRDNITVVGLKI
ncbi:MAG: Stp1/IreP family PP2C-type Ser/Thr phosphatase [Clostridiales bacterium]|nr:Stp1/IreP family PP2C-type Ser/Thr phosphatase [Clostridiales bacterium]MDD7036153.1 Stp1/IreP family PP2C-type Ser/Thr phosphatase [Bacillota bacterium]MDY2921187.1 Stp1/IreP family PP2C-type Ser/Thr phosphatase [Lentihominibacter sp.]